jgi:uncharacterized membrane protein/glutaredoxin
MGRRRKETLWIHQWSRPIIGAIATIGALGTGYLTLIKFMGGDAACPTSGCDQVLSSPYADIFGLPLTLFGCLAYLSMVVLALGPTLVNADTQKELRTKLDNWTWPLLFIGATGMMVFSGYLMFLLATVLKAACLYCIASAAFTLTMFLVTILGNPWRDQGQLFFTGFLVAVVAFIGTLGLYAVNPSTRADVPGNAFPAVTTVSGDSEVALARHLKSVGAKMYGAYWCPHCHDQKSLFGKEAAKSIPYVECADDGENSQADLCRANPNITGFPTWEVKGQLLSGTQSLEDLATASGYTGPKDFKN